MKMLSVLFLFLLNWAPSFAQAKPPGDLRQLLTLYYSIKNSLAEDDSNSAAVNAQSFLNYANSMDHHLLYEGDLHALILDAVTISGTRDLKKQRQCFCNMSANMGVIANTIKLSNDVIFKQYCPLKRASWLSNERVIKNPFHGTGNISCDEVIEIIQ